MNDVPEDFLERYGDVEHLGGQSRTGDNPPPPNFKSSKHIGGNPHPPAAAAEEMRIIDPRTLQNIPIPDRRWIVQDWLPFGHVTALYGDGGTGKTLLAQQLMTSCATGRPWLGMATERCKSFALFCEDDEDELHRRQDAINEQSGLSFNDLGDMRWVSGVGANNVIYTFASDGMGGSTDRLDQLTAAIKGFGATLVIIDTAADTFGGNENDRSQVRQFIGACLNKLARDIGGAVLLNAHPSRSGMSSTGDLDGGSTAWSNTVRSRWSLARPKGDDDAPDSDERILTRRKANYAAIGTEARLRWQRGVLVPLDAVAGVSPALARAKAEGVFLELLDDAMKQGRHVSASPNAGNFAPKAFSKAPRRNGVTRKEFEHAMAALFNDAKIIVGQYGRPGDRHHGIIRVLQNGVPANE